MQEQAKQELEHLETPAEQGEHLLQLQRETHDVVATAEENVIASSEQANEASRLS